MRTRSPPAPMAVPSAHVVSKSRYLARTSMSETNAASSRAVARRTGEVGVSCRVTSRSISSVAIGIAMLMSRSSVTP
jgi:hypothetical protein